MKAQQVQLAEMDKPVIVGTGFGLVVRAPQAIVGLGGAPTSINWLEGALWPVDIIRTSRATGAVARWRAWEPAAFVADELCEWKLSLPLAPFGGAAYVAAGAVVVASSRPIYQVEVLDEAEARQAQPIPPTWVFLGHIDTTALALGPTLTVRMPASGYQAIGARVENADAVGITVLMGGGALGVASSAPYYTIGNGLSVTPLGVGLASTLLLTRGQAVAGLSGWNLIAEFNLGPFVSMDLIRGGAGNLLGRISLFGLTQERPG